MLKHRIIPVLLHDGVQVVKPVSFERPYRKLGTLWQYLNIYEERNVDELILLDIEATPHKRPPNLQKLRAFSDVLFCPITYGGGIHFLDDIRECLANGADKVAIQTHTELIPNAAQKFGKQAIVAVVEYNEDDGRDFVVERCRTMQLYGAGEVLLTARSRDGAFTGYDIPTISSVTSELDIPVIALGGAASATDFADAISAGASAAAAGSIFLYTEHTPRSIAEDLVRAGRDDIRV